MRSTIGLATAVLLASLVGVTAPSVASALCSLICPLDITVPNDLNQCGATVTYPRADLDGNVRHDHLHAGEWVLFPRHSRRHDSRDVHCDRSPAALVHVQYRSR
ncbi:MAG: hypothetical protein ACRDRB_18655 [Pseudonocardiaceae bacterium]